MNFGNKVASVTLVLVSSADTLEAAAAWLVLAGAHWNTRSGNDPISKDNILR